MNDTLTAAQYDTSRTLADAFGHGSWASVPSRGLPVAWPASAYVIYKTCLSVLARAGGENWVPEDFESSWDVLPTAKHTTATGRTEWVIATDGSVTVFVHRPGRSKVLTARVGALVKNVRSVAVSWAGADVHARHVHALWCALRPLVDDAMASKKMSALVGPDRFASVRAALLTPEGWASLDRAPLLSLGCVPLPCVRDKRPVPNV